MEPEALKALYETLHRYAGWLDRERTSILVRADVQALGVAIDTRADPTPPLQALETNLARLPNHTVRVTIEVCKFHTRRNILYHTAGDVTYLRGD